MTYTGSQLLIEEYKIRAQARGVTVCNLMEGLQGCGNKCLVEDVAKCGIIEVIWTNVVKTDTHKVKDRRRQGERSRGLI